MKADCGKIFWCVVMAHVGAFLFSDDHPEIMHEAEAFTALGMNKAG